MHLPALALLGLLLATEAPLVAAQHLLRFSSILRPRHDTLEQAFHRGAIHSVQPELRSRQAEPREVAHNEINSPEPVSIHFNDANINSTTAGACLGALSSITSVTDAAGMAACYNVLYLNNVTGVFEADLRLYQISQPAGSFTGVQATDVSVGLLYPKAAVSIMTNKAKRGDQIERQSAGEMNELQQYSFIGQIDKTLTLTKLRDTDLMALVIPAITLEAESPTTQAPISTNMTSASIVYFVTGVFAGQTASGAAAAVPSAAAAAAQKAAAFTLPGTTPGIFPVGLVITATWTLLFVAAVGFGTLERIRFRDEYRQMVSKARAGTRDRHHTWHHLTFGRSSN